MQQVRVIKAEGVTLRGPLTLKLTQQQVARRRPLLGEPDKSGVVTLDGGQAVQFKFGEELGVDGFDRLNKSLFELVGDAPKPTGKRGRPKGSTAKKAKPAKAAPAPVGEGDAQSGTSSPPLPLTQEGTPEGAGTEPDGAAPDAKPADEGAGAGAEGAAADSDPPTDGTGPTGDKPETAP